MLKVPTPFPQVGSYALFIDDAQPAPQSAELVRVLRRYRQDREAPVAVAFPLRIGATGNLTTTVDKLIDATPLSKDEERALTDALNSLRGRDRLSPKLKELKAAADKLRSRQIHAIILESELAKLRARHARDERRAGGSRGGRIAA